MILDAKYSPLNVEETETFHTEYSKNTTLMAKLRRRCVAHIFKARGVITLMVCLAILLSIICMQQVNAGLQHRKAMARQHKARLEGFQDLKSSKKSGLNQEVVHSDSQQLALRSFLFQKGEKREVDLDVMDLDKGFKTFKEAAVKTEEQKEEKGGFVNGYGHGFLETRDRGKNEDTGNVNGAIVRNNNGFSDFKKENVAHNGKPDDNAKHRSDSIQNGIDNRAVEIVSRKGEKYKEKQNNINRNDEHAGNIVDKSNDFKKKGDERMGDSHDGRGYHSQGEIVFRDLKPHRPAKGNESKKDSKQTNSRKTMDSPYKKPYKHIYRIESGHMVKQISYDSRPIKKMHANVARLRADDAAAIKKKLSPMRSHYARPIFSRQNAMSDKYLGSNAKEDMSPPHKLVVSKEYLPKSKDALERTKMKNEMWTHIDGVLPQNKAAILLLKANKKERLAWQNSGHHKASLFTQEVKNFHDEKTEITHKNGKQATESVKMAHSGEDGNHSALTEPREGYQRGYHSHKHGGLPQHDAKHDNINIRKWPGSEEKFIKEIIDKTGKNRKLNDILSAYHNFDDGRTDDGNNENTGTAVLINQKNIKDTRGEFDKMESYDSFGEHAMIPRPGQQHPKPMEVDMRNSKNGQENVPEKLRQLRQGNYRNRNGFYSSHGENDKMDKTFVRGNMRDGGVDIGKRIKTFYSNLLNRENEDIVKTPFRGQKDVKKLNVFHDQLKRKQLKNGLKEDQFSESLRDKKMASNDPNNLTEAESMRDANRRVAQKKGNGRMKENHHVSLSKYDERTEWEEPDNEMFGDTQNDTSNLGHSKMKPYVFTDFIESNSNVDHRAVRINPDYFKSFKMGRVKTESASLNENSVKQSVKSRDAEQLNKKSEPATEPSSLKQDFADKTYDDTNTMGNKPQASIDHDLKSFPVLEETDEILRRKSTAPNIVNMEKVEEIEDRDEFVEKSDKRRKENPNEYGLPETNEADSENHAPDETSPKKSENKMKRNTPSEYFGENRVHHDGRKEHYLTRKLRSIATEHEITDTSSNTEDRDITNNAGSSFKGHGDDKMIDLLHHGYHHSRHIRKKHHDTGGAQNIHQTEHEHENQKHRARPATKSSHVCKCPNCKDHFHVSKHSEAENNSISSSHRNRHHDTGNHDENYDPSTDESLEDDGQISPEHGRIRRRGHDKTGLKGGHGPSRIGRELPRQGEHQHDIKKDHKGSSSDRNGQNKGHTDRQISHGKLKNQNKGHLNDDNAVKSGPKMTPVPHNPDADRLYKVKDLDTVEGEGDHNHGVKESHDGNNHKMKNNNISDDKISGGSDLEQKSKDPDNRQSVHVDASHIGSHYNRRHHRVNTTGITVFMLSMVCVMTLMVCATAAWKSRMTDHGPRRVNSRTHLYEPSPKY